MWKLCKTCPVQLRQGDRTTRAQASACFVEDIITEPRANDGALVKVGAGPAAANAGGTVPVPDTLKAAKLKEALTP